MKLKRRKLIVSTDNHHEKLLELDWYPHQVLVTHVCSDMREDIDRIMSRGLTSVKDDLRYALRRIDDLERIARKDSI